MAAAKSMPLFSPEAEATLAQGVVWGEKAATAYFFAKMVVSAIMGLLVLAIVYMAMKANNNKKSLAHSSNQKL